MSQKTILSFLLFFITCGTSVFSQVSMDVNTDQPVVIDTKGCRSRPMVIAEDNGFLYTWNYGIKGRNGFGHFIRKISMETGQEAYNVKIPEEKFNGYDLIYRDSYYHNGKVHVLYRTEKFGEDSIYLIKRTIDDLGALSSPKIIVSGWLDDEDKLGNLFYTWNGKGSAPVAITSTKGPDGNVVINKIEFDLDLNPAHSHNYLFPHRFEQTQILSHLEENGKSYLLVGINQGGENPSAVILEISNGELKSGGVRISHPHFSKLSLHTSGDNIRYSYLTFEDKKKKNLKGIHTYEVHFGGDPIKKTDYHFEEEFLNGIKEYSDWGTYKKSNYTIKRIVEQPNGGSVISIHKTVGIKSMDDPYATGSFYSIDMIVTMVNSLDIIDRVHFFPIRSEHTSYLTVNNFCAFTPDGKYVEFFQTSERTLKNWNAGIKYSRLGDGILVACIMSHDSTLQVQSLFDSEDFFFRFSPLNTYRISPDSRDYYVIGNKSYKSYNLIKISIEGLIPDAQDPRRDVIKYGYKW